MKWEHLNTLLWKCWCMRKRSYIVTALEIILPLLLVTIIASVNDSGKGHDSGKNSSESIPEPFSEEIIFHECLGSSSVWDVLYAPADTKFENIIEKAIKILKTNSLNVNVIPLENELSVEKWFKDHYSNTSNKGFGVIFNEGASGLQYTIREAIAENERGVSDLFPPFEFPGPMQTSRGYLYSGFLCLQVSLNKAYMETLNITPDVISLQEFPYPAFRAIDVHSQILLGITFTLYFGYYMLWPSLIKTVLLEKGTGAREWLKMVGVPGWLIWLHWIFYSMFTYLITSIGCTVLLTFPIFGPTLLGSNPLIIWMFIFLFCTSCCILSLLISTLFVSPLIGSAVGAAVFLCSFSTTFNYIYNHTLSHSESLLASLLPVCNLIIGFQSIASAETLKSGVTFRTLFAYNGKVLGLGFFMITSLISMSICLILIWYIDSVHPGKFGRAKPWNFILSPFLSMFKKETDDAHDISVNLNSNAVYEEVDENMKIGLSIRNVHKKYGNTCALECINVDIYEGQITALLGHNGAGKTTLMSIVAGLFSPTSGAVLSSQGDIYEVLYEYRKNLGLCLQNNLLFDYFTVEEHLILFSMIKGIRKIEYLSKNQELLSKFNLLEKKNEFAGKLSGGMKRKLCLAISLIGNPKVLILDEPTSGMDPESRRAMWDLLLSMRGNRTIIISTHFMEEADALGDRIAILSLGSIKCYATSLYLKKHYGEGYYLNISKAALSSSEDIMSCVKKHVRGVSVVSDSELQLTLNLPTSETITFNGLFDDLEKNLNRLKIKSLGLSCTTMEDVFLKVSKDDDEKVLPEIIEKPPPNEGNILREELGITSIKLKGISLFVQRVIALLRKKLYWVSHNIYTTLLYLVLTPFFLSWLTVRGNNLIYETLIDPVPPMSVALDLSTYGYTKVFVESPLNDQNSKLINSFKKLVDSSGSSVLNIKADSNITEDMLHFAVAEEDFYRHHVIISSTFRNTVTFLYSSIAIHSMPLSVAYFYNSYLAMNGKEAIQTSSHPFVFDTPDICSKNTELQMVPFIWMLIFPLGLIVVIGSFIKFYFEERVNCGKHLQFMTGVSPLTYWLSGFIWDFLLILCSVLLMVLTLYAFDSTSLISAFTPLGVLFLVIILAAVSGVWLSYFFSFFFETVSSCFAFFILGNIIFSIVAAILTIFLSDKFHFLRYIFNLNPFFVFAVALKNALYIIVNQYTCSHCPNLDIICESLEKNGGLTYFSWKDGINEQLVYLIVDGLLYMMLTFMIEYQVFQKIFHYFFQIYVHHSDTLDIVSDDDVSCEKDRVDSSVTPGDTVDASENHLPEVIVKNLGMKYKKDFVAVEDVNFAVDKGEVFGLLGVNGAGKTTTFKMLTGVILPTKGTSFIHGYHLYNNRSQYLSHIGYCPQFEALNESLTGEELLKTYALLRGLSPRDVNTAVKSWISLIGLGKYCNHSCGQYSGGNKRKLSTAIAFIGDPDVIFLDEPTSGVDPITRRKLWNILSKVKAKRQAVIITSHSMDECEAVCKRLTIMAKGRMQCIGNIQHLKHKYGDGYSLLIKIKPSTSIYTKELLKQKMQELFGHECDLKDEHIGLLQYHVRSTNHSWSSLFSILETLKSSQPEVEDYIVTATSLEQVFLSFAQSTNPL